MTRKDFFMLAPIVLLSILFIVLISWRQSQHNSRISGLIDNSGKTTSQPPVKTEQDTVVRPNYSFNEPVIDFKARIIKKPFGLKVSPQNSPISPERFAGYHTGVDAEYGDVTSDVPVYAIADGTIMISKEALGYGGVFLLSFELNGSKHSAVYGHIRPSSLPAAGKSFKKGEQIALLGTGYTPETDGERKHLHLGILVDNGTDLRGYVATRQELSGWIDPLSLYN